MNNIILLAENVPANMEEGFVVLCLVVVGGIFILGTLAKWIN